MKTPMSMSRVGDARIFLRALAKLGRKHGFKIVGDAGIESMDDHADLNAIYAVTADGEGGYGISLEREQSILICVKALNHPGTELICSTCRDGRGLKPSMDRVIETVPGAVCADCLHAF